MFKNALWYLDEIDNHQWHCCKTFDTPCDGIVNTYNLLFTITKQTSYEVVAINHII